MTFILRLSIDPTGGVTGVIERVKTGQKQRFHDVAEIGPAVASMIAEERQRVGEEWEP